jgi:hypothetical protein
MARDSKLIQELVSSTSIPQYVTEERAVGRDTRVRVRTIGVMDSGFQQGFGSLRIQRISIKLLLHGEAIIR